MSLSTPPTSWRTTAKMKNVAIAIEKAERAAEKKAGLRTKRKRFLTGRPGRFSRGGLPYAAPPSPAPYPLAQQMLPDSGCMPHSQEAQWSSARQVANGPYIGPCFACGDVGHLRAFCPKTHPERNRKEIVSFPNCKKFNVCICA